MWSGAALAPTNKSGTTTRILIAGVNFEFLRIVDRIHQPRDLIAMVSSNVLVPGDTVSAKSGTTPGAGTHLYQSSSVHASLAGLGRIAKSSANSPAHSASVLQWPSSPTSNFSASTPCVGDVVFGRVTRTSPKQAQMDIIAIGMTGSNVLSEPFQALIRQQDIRATEVDKVKLSESFRVGDIVRGVVISLGDERNYYVSTATNEFGVILATSEQGRNQMVPISWREMRDMALGVNELRKVAKVV